MDDIERKARELLATQYDADSHAFTARQIRADPGALGEDFVRSLRAIIAAITPPEGYVLVPVKISKEIEDVLHESFEYGYSAESTWDLAIHAARPEASP